MAPHVLGSAVASAGAGQHTSPALWKAYGARALELRKRLTPRDVRRILQGHAAAGIQDVALFQDLLQASLPDRNASEKDLCSMAISLAKLRCGTESLDPIAKELDERSDSRLGDLTSTDVSSLANALSRVSASSNQAGLLQKLADRLCADASSTLLPPVSTTMALNAFAVVKHCDSQLFNILVSNSIRPCISDFTVTQAALAVDALARCCPVTEDLATEAFRCFVQHWLSQGLLDEAEPEDLAHLANSAVKLKILEEEELNQVLAAAGLRNLSRFSTPQLAMFSSSLARLPSTGREAFMSVVALRILPQALRSCCFVDLGLILQAMATCDITLTRDVATLCQKRLSEVAKEELADLAANKQARDASYEAKLNSAAAALERISEASLKVFLIDFEGLPGLLAALRPLCLELFAQKALRLRTAAALLSMHAQLRLRLDSDLSAALDAAASVSTGAGSTGDSSGRGVASPVLAGRLLRGMAPVGHPVKSLMLIIDQSFTSSRGWQRTLPALAADLFAAALLDFAHLSESTVNSLLQAAKVHCESLVASSNASMDSTLQLKCASEISAASHAWLRHEVQNPGDAMWLADWAEEVFSAANGPQHDLVPPVDRGLLRSVFASMEPSEVELLAAWPVQGFRADLVVRFQSQLVAINVNGPERFYAGTQEPLASCGLRTAALAASGAKVCEVNFWEWPTEPAEQRRWMTQRLDEKGRVNESEAVIGTPVNSPCSSVDFFDARAEFEKKSFEAEMAQAMAQSRLEEEQRQNEEGGPPIIILGGGQPEPPSTFNGFHEEDRCYRAWNRVHHARLMCFIGSDGQHYFETNVTRMQHIVGHCIQCGQNYIIWHNGQWWKVFQVFLEDNSRCFHHVSDSCTRGSNCNQPHGRSGHESSESLQNELAQVLMCFLREAPPVRRPRALDVEFIYVYVGMPPASMNDQVSEVNGQPAAAHVPEATLAAHEEDENADIDGVPEASGAPVSGSEEGAKPVNDPDVSENERLATE
ncbi:unnamed protein product [Durusdinium trenchii]|uniref:C3H1-type domain-containing protein n=1 Tax=Durusdinium trenchii TaxID=1381693 RepID=A0ABP0RTU0_9DINO